MIKYTFIFHIIETFKNINTTFSQIIIIDIGFVYSHQLFILDAIWTNRKSLHYGKISGWKMVNNCSVPNCKNLDNLSSRHKGITFHRYVFVLYLSMILLLVKMASNVLYNNNYIVLSKQCQFFILLILAKLHMKNIDTMCIL